MTNTTREYQEDFSHLFLSNVRNTTKSTDIQLSFVHLGHGGHHIHAVNKDSSCDTGQIKLTVVASCDCGVYATIIRRVLVNALKITGREVKHRPPSCQNCQVIGKYLFCDLQSETRVV